jgi:GT2 family glycosyltransferase
VNDRQPITDHGLPITRYPKVSIIILNWNGLTDTIECLESLKKITYPNSEVVIVDNASRGNDVQVLQEKFGDYVHLIQNDRNYGFPEGCNIGMRYALTKGADYLLLLNNDTVVDPEFLTEMVKVAEADPSIGITGSKIYYYYEPNRIQAAGGKINWWLGYIDTYGREDDTGQYDTIAERDYLYGTSFLIKKDVIEKISFMDPFFFFGVEEYDYCTRASRAGFKVVYVPGSKVWHKAGASSAKLPDHPETLRLIRKSSGRGEYKYYYRLFRKHGPPVLFVFPFFGAAVLQLSLWRAAIRLARRGEWQELKRDAKAMLWRF